MRGRGPSPFLLHSSTPSSSTLPPSPLLPPPATINTSTKGPPRIKPAAPLPMVDEDWEGRGGSLGGYCTVNWALPPLQQTRGPLIDLSPNPTTISIIISAAILLLGKGQHGTAERWLYLACHPPLPPLSHPFCTVPLPAPPLRHNAGVGQLRIGRECRRLLELWPPSHLPL